MKPNTKNKIREMSEEQLINRFQYLKSKQLPKKESNVMRYIRYQLRTRFEKVLDKI